MTDAVLDVRDLSIAFGPEGRRLTAVHGVDLQVSRGEVVTLVGESGSGKTATAMALARLNEGAGSSIAGHITLDGQDVLSLDARALRTLRGRSVAVVFQDAATALNPCETIGDQIAEALVVHGAKDWRGARARAVELLTEVGLPEPDRRAHLFPHELSGGQRQRAMIAVALACDPAFLIADEPTTALDVTVQAQVLAVLRDLVRRRGMGLLLITHDLGVVAGVADRVIVLYAGRAVETAPVEVFFDTPAHPYAAAMIKLANAERDSDGRLAAIPGAPPSLGAVPQGCPFAPRCSAVRSICRGEAPSSRHVAPDHAVCCHFPIGAS